MILQLKLLLIILSIFSLFIIKSITCNFLEGNKNNLKKENTIIEKLKLVSDLIKIYSELYDYSREGYNKPKFLKQTREYNFFQKKLDISICVIAKNENLYIKEFVEYYFKLGVDKIFVYDNNDLEGENFNVILGEYIKNKFVDIIDVRGISSIQIPIYNYCYRKNKNFYDWIGFLDIDEYLFIENKVSIKNYLSHERFNKCQTVFFNWIMFNDNNLIKYDSRNLINRFKNPTFKFNQGKSFVRGKINRLVIPTTHIPGININNFCNSNGELIYPKNFFGYKFEKNPKAFIKHFYTKTVEEFCDKINKGHAHFHKNHTKYISTMDERIKLFFKLNKITKEKLDILENCTRIKLNIPSISSDTLMKK